MIRSSGADIISIEVRKEAEKRVNLRFKINLDDELDISDVLTDIVSIDEVDKVELIEHQ